MDLTLSDSLRDELKIPLGRLIPARQVSRATLEAIIPSSSYVVSVGDRTTKNMTSFGMTPSLQIIDNQERRKEMAEPNTDPVSSELYCTNPPAEINPQSITVIREALSLRPPARIIVDGEEDLLVIPACIYAPDGSTVLYGQPGQGLVVVPVTAEIRNKTRNILDRMGYDEKVAV